MVYGAAGAGARAMTSSSSPGIALKQEGISYIAGAQLPCVVVNLSLIHISILCCPYKIASKLLIIFARTG